MGNLSPRFILVTIFTSNFIGVAFARTLHYQFYCWYFHTLPYLLWHVRGDVVPVVLKVAIFGAIEVCFNVFPATWWSSALLQVRAGCTDQRKRAVCWDIGIKLLRLPMCVRRCVI
jgi:hypothetical protein